MTKRIQKLLNIQNLIGFFGFFYFIYPGIKEPVFRFLSQEFSKNYWDGISAVAISITVVYIARQSRYLGYQTKPIAWLFLMSPKTLGIIDDRNWLFVKNESKYTIFLYYKIEGPKIDDGEKTLPHDGSWDNKCNPLHIYPTLMQYPSVIPQINPDLIKKAGDNNKKIRIDIYYGLAPEYASEEIQQAIPNTWRFDPVEKIWEGPNGMTDKGFLPVLKR